MALDIIISEQGTLNSVPPATGTSNINVGFPERILSTFLGAASTMYGLRHLGSLSGITMAVAGGYLLSRGLTGHCALYKALGKDAESRTSSAMEARGTFLIDKPKEEVYAFWRKLENLPRFMQHLEEVKEVDATRSTWKAKIPGGVGTVSWEAEITEDVPDERISWASLPGSTIDNAGEVSFRDAANGGTEIKTNIVYRLPGGDVGSIAAKLFNPMVENMMREDVKRFKSIMETGMDQESQLSDTTSEITSTVKKPRQSRKKASSSPDESLNKIDTPDRDTLQSYENNFMERD